MAPSLKLRTQFTFFANDRTLSCIFSKLAKKNVNIAGHFQTRTRNKLNFVRMVVGSPISENTKDLRTIVNILKSFNVKSKNNRIIQITNTPAGVPGIFNTIYGILWCKVIVKSMYIGEQDIIFLDVSNVQKAISILSQRNPKQCTKKC